MVTQYEYLKNYYKYTNWRYVSYESKKSSFRYHNKNGIWVLIDTYQASCFMYGMSVEEFFYICKKGNYNSFRDHYWDVSHLAYCERCNGAGKADWISSITGPQPFEKARHKYIRDKSKILKFQHDDFLRNCIFAPTKVFKGERICKDCKGSGIYIHSNNLKNLLLYDIDKI